MAIVDSWLMIDDWWLIFFIVGHLQIPGSMLHAMHVMQWLRWKKLVQSGFERLEVEGIWKIILLHGVPEPCSSWNKGAIKLLCAVGFELNSKTVAFAMFVGCIFWEQKVLELSLQFHRNSFHWSNGKRVQDHQHHDAIATETSLQLCFRCLRVLLLFF